MLFYWLWRCNLYFLLGRFWQMVSFIVDSYMIAMCFMHFVYFHLVRMDWDILEDFSENIVNRCVNYVAYSATDNVQWYLGLIELLKESFRICSKNQVRGIQGWSSHVYSNFMIFKQFSLHIVELINELVFFRKGDCAIGLIWSIKKIIIQELLSELFR